MRTIFGILFAASMILSIAFLSNAISSNNPFSASAQINQKRVNRKIQKTKRIDQWNGGKDDWEKHPNTKKIPPDPCRNGVTANGRKCKTVKARRKRIEVGPPPINFKRKHP